jgi:catechol 2,3-dioxygenase-like lactoylglutathione lyase family enzyme
MPVATAAEVVDSHGMGHGMQVSTVNISCPDPPALARFYAALLGMEVTTEEPTWVVISGGGGRPRPFQLGDLPGAVAHALEVGARLADHQPQDDVRVCLDPAGHPFCLWVDAGE